MRISPVRSLPPLTLITDDIYDLPAELVVSYLRALHVDQDVATSLDPDGVAKARWKLEKGFLAARQTTQAEVAACCFDNASDGLRRRQGIWRGRRLFCGDLEVAPWATHSD